MQKKMITTPQAPKAIGPYSQAIRIDATVYFSGQIPLDPQTMQLVSADFKMQAIQVMKNLQAVSRAAGGDLKDIVKLTIYLTDIEQFTELNTVMMDYFSEPYPARTTIEVSALPRGSQVEVEAIMVLEKDKAIGL